MDIVNNLQEEQEQTRGYDAENPNRPSLLDLKKNSSSSSRSCKRRECAPRLSEDHYCDEDVEEDERDIEEETEALELISVNNKEELASVLDRLASEGIRAEVVYGAATLYVKSPTTSL
ncbi:hypothetical protein BGX27_009168 [Mortierella sp. AM989]|nr:hypothetical protein BGX27_009168 [Mortierella sp. AM989]